MSNDCWFFLSLYFAILQAHGSLELLGLIIVGTELVMKLKWQGWRTFVRHKRTMIKVSNESDLDPRHNSRILTEVSCRRLRYALWS